MIQTIHAVCSRLERVGTPGQAVFFVDELSAFDGERLAATLECNRSAGVPTMLATQLLSNFDSAGGTKLLHGALDNSELLIAPEAAELLVGWPARRRRGSTPRWFPTPPATWLRIATVPFTLRNFKEDLEDLGSRFDGAPDLEFRLATEALSNPAWATSASRPAIAFRTATRTRRRRRCTWSCAGAGG